MYRGSGEGQFTDYLEALALSKEPPPDQRVEAVLSGLWRLIQAELRRRGLWLRQPGYLGVYGVSSWSQANQPSDLFESEAWELVAECFRYIFLDRYSYLARQLQAGANVEGLVRRNVRNFVHDTQKKHDPLGYRVFTVLRKAALELIENGRLFVLDGDERLRNVTLVGFDPASDGPTGADEEVIRARLAALVPSWNDILLPDLLTAHGRGLVKIQEITRRLFERLPQQEVQMFRFRDLVEPIKQDVRQRWGALFDTEQGDTAIEEGSEPGLLRLVRRVQPDTSLADRESFAQLLRCVDQRLATADLRPKRREHLEKLWQFLSLYASHPETRDVPSNRVLAEQLQIPRNSMASLYDELRELTKLCQESSGDGAGEARAAQATPDSAATGAGPEAASHVATSLASETTMKPRTTTLAELRDAALREHQRFLATQAALASGAQSDLSSGDLLSLPETAEYGIEWLLVRESTPEEATSQPVAWLIPVDDSPLRGTSDIDVPGSEGGPLVVRCGQALQLAPEALARAEAENGLLHGRRTGRLAPRRLEQIEAMLSALPRLAEAQGETWDPEYEFWLDDGVLPARAALETALAAARDPESASASGSATVHPFRQPESRSVDAPSRPGPRAWQRPFARAAAVLATLGIGLLAMLVWQQDQISDLRQQLQGETEEAVGMQALPRFDLPPPGNLRNLDDTVEIEVAGGRLALSIPVPEPSAGYRAELLSAEGERLQQVETISDAYGQILLRLHGLRIEDRLELELKLFRLQGGSGLLGGSAELIASYDLVLTAASRE